MKNIFKYILAAAAVSFAATACVEEETHPYGEPDVDGCYGVYFPVQDASGSHTYDPTMTKEITISVSRKNTKGNITVPYNITTDTPEAFKCGEIAFEDGQTETKLLVTFPSIETGVTYNLSLSISDPQYASKYDSGACSFDFSVMCVEWKKFFGPGASEEKAEGELTTKTLENISDVTSVKTEMSYYETSYPNINFCKLSKVFDFTEGAEPIDYIFYWNTSTNNLYVPSQEFYTRSDGKNIAVGDAAAFYDSYYAWGSTPDSGAEYFTWQPAWLAKNGFYQPHYDGAGGFYLADCIYLVEGGKATGSGWAFGDDASEMSADLYVAPGFVRVDYTLEMSSDYPENGEMPVEFKSGVDVASIKFICVEGKATPGQITDYSDQIAAGTAKDMGEIKEFYYDEKTGFNYAGIYVTFDKTNTYTLVAGAFDKTGKMQSMGSIYLDYVAADDANYDVNVTCGLGETPVRYESAGYDKYNSLEYYVSISKDASEAKVGLYKTATVEKYGMDVIIADLRENIKSVSGDILEEMKGVGGFCSLFTKLSHNTDYTVVAWVTNGTKAAYATASFATAKIPEKFKSLGIGSYTDDLIGPLFQAPPITYEVEIEESEETPGKYRLINPYGEAFPYNQEGDWDDSQDWDIIIFANNPERVYIPFQETGCDWGYGNMAIFSMAYYYLANGKTADEVAALGLYGTLKDGIITFPVDGLAVQDNDGAYKGNSNGAFKVILPSAYNPSASSAAPISAKRSSMSCPGENVLAPMPLSQGVKADFSYSRDAKSAAFEVAENYVKKSNASSKSISKEEFRLN